MTRAMWTNVSLVVVLAASLTLLVGCFGGNGLILDLDGTQWYRAQVALMQYAQVMNIYDLHLDFGAADITGQMKPTATPEGGPAHISFDGVNITSASSGVKPQTTNSFSSSGVYTQDGNNFAAQFPDPTASMVPQFFNVESVSITGTILDSQTLDCNVTVNTFSGQYQGSVQISAAIPE
jgi:hypothetical protein